MSRRSIRRSFPIGGTSVLVAKELGSKAKCLVDLGQSRTERKHRTNRRAPCTPSASWADFISTIRNTVDDDLDSGSINPHQLFLVFNELVIAEQDQPSQFGPAYMIDQSHNITDPAESLLSSAEAILCRIRQSIDDRSRACCRTINVPTTF